MNAPNPEVDERLSRAAQWREEQLRLREICLDTPLLEEVKWRQPCYTLGGKNVVIVSAFKGHACLAFFKGVLLKDEHGLLHQAGEHTQSGRQMRFTSVEQIEDLEPIVRAYLAEAIEIERAGRTVELKKMREYAVPAELQEQLDADAAFRAAFEALTPGRQRGYFLHIGGAKQTATRSARVEKHRPRILAGKGIHDR
ncbi:YdeI/OmpD-associated family protein [Rubricoccus marinus]|uniref:YdhG-like domain-containing protein n=1 Tax=Rubricoccus marinus TaxID=716817 RepID=A0A259U279_9BACT|nr:YdeI/OmpD-associated family protein [Rubricoccus marinus]OZC03947.1 hypothetical protein BSZ36_13725 [Rubricoccus marinus]